MNNRLKVLKALRAVVEREGIAQEKYYCEETGCISYKSIIRNLLTRSAVSNKLPITQI